MSNRFARPENFASRLRTPLLREHYVYRVFNAAGELLYVGCTINVGERMKGHRSNRVDWLALMSRVSVTGPFNYETARQVERDAIHSERPHYNNNTPERTAVVAAHQRIYKRRYSLLIAEGVEFWEAHRAARKHALSVLPAPDHRDAFKASDFSIPAALRADREDAVRHAEVA